MKIISFIIGEKKIMNSFKGPAFKIKNPSFFFKQISRCNIKWAPSYALIPDLKCNLERIFSKNFFSFHIASFNNHSSSFFGMMGLFLIIPLVLMKDWLFLLIYLSCVSNQLQLSADLNLETSNKILSGTNNIWAPFKILAVAQIL